MQKKLIALFGVITILANQLVAPASCLAQLSHGNTHCHASPAANAANPGSSYANSSCHTLPTSQAISRICNHSVNGTTSSTSAGSLLRPIFSSSTVNMVRTASHTLPLNFSTNSGFLLLGPQTAQLRSLNIPSGVTAIFDSGAAGTLNLSGSLDNHGTLYLVSSVPSANVASIQAKNIVNEQGGVITTVLPGGGLPGFANLVTGLGLSLTTLNYLSNAGTISSAGSLAIASLKNTQPQGTLTAAPLVKPDSGLASSTASINNSGILQAVQNINISGQTVVNAGQFLSKQSINISTSKLSNSGLIQALAGVNIQSPTSQLFVDNSKGSIIGSSILLSTLSGTDSSKAALNLTGGRLTAGEIFFDSPRGKLSVDADRIDGNVQVTAGSALLAVHQGTLKLTRMTVTGDPVLENEDGDIFLPQDLEFPGQDLTILASGNIVYVPDSDANATSSENPAEPNANQTSAAVIPQWLLTRLNIDLSQPDGSTGNGGNLTMVAGFDFTATDTGNGMDYRINKPSATGGSIYLENFSINTSSKTGNGGNVTMIASAGTDPSVMRNEGVVILIGTPASQINTSSVNGKAGDLSIIASSDNIKQTVDIGAGLQSSGGNDRSYIFTGDGGSVSYLAGHSEIQANISAYGQKGLGGTVSICTSQPVMSEPVVVHEGLDGTLTASGSFSPTMDSKGQVVLTPAQQFANGVLAINTENIFNASNSDNPNNTSGAVQLFARTLDNTQTASVIHLNSNGTPISHNQMLTDKGPLLNLNSTQSDNTNPGSIDTSALTADINHLSLSLSDVSQELTDETNKPLLSQNLSVEKGLLSQRSTLSNRLYSEELQVLQAQESNLKLQLASVESQVQTFQSQPGQPQTTIQVGGVDPIPGQTLSQSTIQQFHAETANNFSGGQAGSQSLSVGQQGTSGQQTQLAELTNQIKTLTDQISQADTHVKAIQAQQTNEQTSTQLALQRLPIQTALQTNLQQQQTARDNLSTAKVQVDAVQALPTNSATNQKLLVSLELTEAQAEGSLVSLIQQQNSIQLSDPQLSADGKTQVQTSQKQLQVTQQNISAGLSQLQAELGQLSKVAPTPSSPSQQQNNASSFSVADAVAQVNGLLTDKTNQLGGLIARVDQLAARPQAEHQQEASLANSQSLDLGGTSVGRVVVQSDFKVALAQTIKAQNDKNYLTMDKYDLLKANVAVDQSQIDGFKAQIASLNAQAAQQSSSQRTQMQQLSAQLRQTQSDLQQLRTEEKSNQNSPTEAQSLKQQIALKTLSTVNLERSIILSQTTVAKERQNLQSQINALNSKINDLTGAQKDLNTQISTLDKQSTFSQSLYADASIYLNGILNDASTFYTMKVGGQKISGLLEIQAPPGQNSPFFSSETILQSPSDTAQASTDFVYVWGDGESTYPSPDSLVQSTLQKGNWLGNTVVSAQVMRLDNYQLSVRSDFNHLLGLGMGYSPDLLPWSGWVAKIVFVTQPAPAAPIPVTNNNYNDSSYNFSAVFNNLSLPADRTKVPTNVASAMNTMSTLAGNTINLVKYVPQLDPAKIDSYIKIADQSLNNPALVAMLSQGTTAEQQAAINFIGQLAMQNGAQQSLQIQKINAQAPQYWNTLQNNSPDLQIENLTQQINQIQGIISDFTGDPTFDSSQYTQQLIRLQLNLQILSQLNSSDYQNRQNSLMQQFSSDFIALQALDQQMRQNTWNPEVVFSPDAIRLTSNLQMTMQQMFDQQTQLSQDLTQGINQYIADQTRQYERTVNNAYYDALPLIQKLDGGPIGVSYLQGLNPDIDPTLAQRFYDSKGEDLTIQDKAQLLQLIPQWVVENKELFAQSGENKLTWMQQDQNKQLQKVDKQYFGVGTVVGKGLDENNAIRLIMDNSGLTNLLGIEYKSDQLKQSQSDIVSYSDQQIINMQSHIDAIRSADDANTILSHYSGLDYTAFLYNSASNALVKNQIQQYQNYQGQALAFGETTATVFSLGQGSAYLQALKGAATLTDLAASVMIAGAYRGGIAGTQELTAGLVRQGLGYQSWGETLNSTANATLNYTLSGMAMQASILALSPISSMVLSPLASETAAVLRPFTGEIAANYLGSLPTSALFTAGSSMAGGLLSGQSWEQISANVPNAVMNGLLMHAVASPISMIGNSLMTTPAQSQPRLLVDPATGNRLHTVSDGKGNVALMTPRALDSNNATLAYEQAGYSRILQPSEYPVMTGTVRNVPVLQLQGELPALPPKQIPAIPGDQPSLSLSSSKQPTLQSPGTAPAQLNSLLPTTSSQGNTTLSSNGKLQKEWMPLVTVSPDQVGSLDFPGAQSVAAGLSLSLAQPSQVKLIDLPGSGLGGEYNWVNGTLIGATSDSDGKMTINTAYGAGNTSGFDSNLFNTLHETTHAAHDQYWQYLPADSQAAITSAYRNLVGALGLGKLGPVSNDLLNLEYIDKGPFYLVSFPEQVAEMGAVYLYPVAVPTSKNVPWIEPEDYASRVMLTTALNGQPQRLQAMLGSDPKVVAAQNHLYNTLVEHFFQPVLSKNMIPTQQVSQTSPSNKGPGTTRSQSEGDNYQLDSPGGAPTNAVTSDQMRSLTNPTKGVDVTSILAALAQTDARGNTVGIGDSSKAELAIQLLLRTEAPVITIPIQHWSDALKNGFIVAGKGWDGVEKLRGTLGIPPYLDNGDVRVVVQVANPNLPISPVFAGPNCSFCGVVQFGTKSIPLSNLRPVAAVNGDGTVLQTRVTSQNAPAPTTSSIDSTSQFGGGNNAVTPQVSAQQKK